MQVVPRTLESQTQEELQLPPPVARHRELKRKATTSDAESAKGKKIKISLVPPVDLGD